METINYEKHVTDQLLHFMRNFTFLDTFKKFTEKSEEWCPFNHGDETDYNCYSSFAPINELIIQLERYKLCNKFLNSNRYVLDEYEKHVNLLKVPLGINDYKMFKKILDYLEYDIESLDDHIQKQLEGITCEECIRLDESLVCYSNNCTYSSIIMAISAIEYRLHQMIKNFDNELYIREFEKATLGQIIFQFGENGKYEDIKKLLPKRHCPLIILLNQYRTFAVHPKDEKITPTIVDSVLALSFTFITDTEIEVFNTDQLSCDTSGSKPSCD